MTRHWTRREWTLLVKACALLSLLAFLTAPASSQTPGSQYFPPVAELLGANPETLPSPSRDLRDSLRDLPSFKSSIRALSGGSLESRKAAAAALGVKGNARAVPYLGAVLLKTNEDAALRAGAALALGKIGDWRTTTYLKEAVFDARKEVRFAAALALGKVANLEAVQLLESAAMRDTHWWIRYAGAVALGESRQPSAVPALAEALRRDMRWQVRQQAARSLGQIGTPGAVAALAPALKDEDETIRFTAARALGEAGGMDALEHLHAAYDRESEELNKRMLSKAIRRASSGR